MLKTTAMWKYGQRTGQWRVGTGGAIGLDYNVVYSTMDRMKIKNQIKVLDAVRVMECEALRVINKGESK